MNLITIGNSQYMITLRIDAVLLNQPNMTGMYVLHCTDDAMEYVLSLFNDYTYRLYCNHKDIQRGHILQDIQFDQSITYH